MNNEKYSRYEFLRKMGFSGGALMAVLSSCTVKKDAVLDSLIVNSKGQPVVSLDSTTASATTVPPTTTIGSGTSGSTTNLSGLVTTDQLNTIKSFIVKVDLTASTATALKNDGGYVIVNGSVVVANVTGVNMLLRKIYARINQDLTLYSIVRNITARTTALVSLYLARV
jgi:hypothetical protein